MLFNFLKKKKYPSHTKYKLDDFVRFRHRNELCFGFIHEAFVDENNKITYTIQMCGECPTFAYNYKEEDIIGLMPNRK